MFVSIGLLQNIDFHLECQLYCLDKTNSIANQHSISSVSSAACRIISANTVGLTDPENIGTAVETALLSSLQADIGVLPV